MHVSDRHRAEQQVHATLAVHRATPGKQFISAPLTLTVEALNRVAEQMPVFFGRGRNARVIPQYFEPFAMRCQACGINNRVVRLAIPVALKCRSCGKPLPR